MTLKTAFFAAAATVALVGAPAAIAQDMDGAATTPPTVGEPTPEGAAAFTDAQIDSFAEAMTDIQALNETYGPQVAGESDATARATIQQQMTTEMTAAVTDAGLTAEEYNQIAAAAQGDAALRTRIGQAIQADAGASADASAEAEDQPATEMDDQTQDAADPVAEAPASDM